MVLLHTEASEEMPLCTELGDCEKASKESANLEEASGEAGRETSVEEHKEH